jgi:hypothetical protein
MTIEYDPKCQAPRWLGYFYLLGTSTRIQSGSVLPVFSSYALAAAAGDRAR